MTFTSETQSGSCKLQLYGKATLISSIDEANVVKYLRSITDYKNRYNNLFLIENGQYLFLEQLFNNLNEKFIFVFGPEASERALNNLCNRGTINKRQLVFSRVSSEPTRFPDRYDKIGAAHTVLELVDSDNGKLVLYNKLITIGDSTWQEYCMRYSIKDESAEFTRLCGLYANDEDNILEKIRKDFL